MQLVVMVVLDIQQQQLLRWQEEIKCTLKLGHSHGGCLSSTRQLLLLLMQLQTCGASHAAACSQQQWQQQGETLHTVREDMLLRIG